MTETSWRRSYDQWLDAMARCLFLARVGEFDDALAELDCARRIEDEMAVVEADLAAEMEAAWTP